MYRRTIGGESSLVRWSCPFGDWVPLWAAVAYATVALWWPLATGHRALALCRTRSRGCCPAPRCWRVVSSRGQKPWLRPRKTLPYRVSVASRGLRQAEKFSVLVSGDYYGSPAPSFYGALSSQPTMHLESRRPRCLRSRNTDRAPWRAGLLAASAPERVVCFFRHRTFREPTALVSVDGLRPPYLRVWERV